MKNLIKNIAITLSRQLRQHWSMVACLLILGTGLMHNPTPAQGAEERLSKEAFAKLSAYNHLPLGSATAKVTVYEFSSLTCPHCAAFQRDVFPKIKEKYINSGKIKWQSVDFPLDNVAYGAAIMARCMTDKESYNGFIDTLFKKRDEWITKDPKAAIINIMARAGVDNKAATACLSNKKNIDAVSAARKLGDAIGVNSTPSFFVMDRVVSNNEKELIDAIDKALK